MHVPQYGGNVRVHVSVIVVSPMSSSSFYVLEYVHVLSLSLCLFLSSLLFATRFRFVATVVFFNFLSYQAVGAKAFAAFSCHAPIAGASYLLEDFNIRCDSPSHRVVQGFALAVLIVYVEKRIHIDEPP